MTKFIGYFLQKGYITASQARALEAFVVGTFFSVLLGVLANLDTLVLGGDVDWKAFAIAQCVAVATAVRMGLRKYVEDKRKEALSKLEK